jgi:hypothetical protein
MKLYKPSKKSKLPLHLPDGPGNDLPLHIDKLSKPISPMTKLHWKHVRLGMTFHRRAVDPSRGLVRPKNNLNVPTTKFSESNETIAKLSGLQVLNLYAINDAAINRTVAVKPRKPKSSRRLKRKPAKPSNCGFG